MCCKYYIILQRSHDSVETSSLATNPNQSTELDVAQTVFGEITLSDDLKNPFDFGGGMGYWNDDGSPLTYVRARWLNPSEGRWMSKDPVEGECCFEMLLEHL